MDGNVVLRALCPSITVHIVFVSILDTSSLSRDRLGPLSMSTIWQARIVTTRSMLSPLCIILIYIPCLVEIGVL
ncbi:hypothetical protein PAXRUDRAFT_826524 [Paxillus rubicundulus Ve08.2h10]|uniref:Unplaced genomic scaffold scaffold_191, whole genome shotgun sequence n=1 Tax=Paxillus rubicundulus Ve08.2h10 TaxID=930991 RepID=A0A0D0E486_9AGAM|nr:hypothetical protein PAXRUDRAFT_826524 [Paxillus rubicundulus Ve08.2h10]